MGSTDENEYENLRLFFRKKNFFLEKGRFLSNCYPLAGWLVATCLSKLSKAPLVLNPYWLIDKPAPLCSGIR
jgi:hypothetical protein